jgi:hypothetical protein
MFKLNEPEKFMYKVWLLKIILFPWIPYYHSLCYSILPLIKI